ncbi:MAG: protein TolA, partial [Bacteroidia bacterium]|nr:protein TolA [Bacteroidia bacterium]
LKAEADAKAKAEADAAAAAELAKRKAEFEKFINLGDDALSNQKFDDALNAFNAALGIDYDNNTANERINKAQKAKDEEEARLKAEADAKAKAEADAAAAAELAKKKKEFEEAINKGDQSLSSKNYTDALAQYNVALNIDYDNNTANERINQAQKAKDEEEARLKAEADAKAKAEADAAAAAELARKKKEFEEAINKGDQSLSS